VAIRGDTVLAAAFFDDTEAGTQAGSVLVFGRDGDAWTLRQTLHASDASSGDRFGFAVAMSGESLIVGAFTADSPGLGRTGAAYVFTLDQDQWMEQARLGAPDAEDLDFFGAAVGIDGDTAIVGAPSDDNEWGLFAGSVHLFERGQGVWSHIAMITGPDGAGGDELGWSAEVRGDVALAGAPYDDTYAGHDAGSAVLATRIGGAWAEQDRIIVGGDPDYRFGHSAALGDGVALIGAYGAEEIAGLTFALELNCGPCPADCDGLGGLDLFDFLCFINEFNNAQPYADCNADGEFDLFDFLCFTNAFNAGC
jgi:hypothetical protein